MNRTRWRSRRDGSRTSTRSRASPPFSRYVATQHADADGDDGDDGDYDDDADVADDADDAGDADDADYDDNAESKLLFLCNQQISIHIERPHQIYVHINLIQEQIS